MEHPPEKKTEAELQDALHERDVEGIEELPADEQEAVVEAAYAEPARAALSK